MLLAAPPNIHALVVPPVPRTPQSSPRAPGAPQAAPTHRRRVPPSCIVRGGRAAAAASGGGGGGGGSTRPTGRQEKKPCIPSDAPRLPLAHEHSVGVCLKNQHAHTDQRAPQSLAHTSRGRLGTAGFVWHNLPNVCRAWRPRVAVTCCVACLKRAPLCSLAACLGDPTAARLCSRPQRLLKRRLLRFRHAKMAQSARLSRCAVLQGHLAAAREHEDDRGDGLQRCATSAAAAAVPAPPAVRGWAAAARPSRARCHPQRPAMRAIPRAQRPR